MQTGAKEKNRFSGYKWYLLYEVLLFIIIFSLWWFRGEHTPRRFSDISFLVGIRAMLLGLVLYWGTRNATGNFGYQFSQTASNTNMQERVNRDWKERFANEKLILVAIIIGLIPILSGILAYKIWG